MAVLKYADLLADAEAEQAASTTEFIAKDGKKVLLRPILLLSKEELKVVQVLLKTVTNDDADTWERIEAMDNILLAAADKKSSLKASLADLPPKVRTHIFQTWMSAGNQGEASA